MKIIDRIYLFAGWLTRGHAFILDHCTETITELETYSWLDNKDNTPEDGHDHCINADQYGFIPYKMKIGSGENKDH